MELLYDSVCEFRDSTDDLLFNIRIAIVTDQMIDSYRDGVEYDFAEYGFDLTAAEKIWLHGCYPCNALIDNCLKEIAHNCINIDNDSHLTRYLELSIKRFKQIKQNVDFKFRVQDTLKVYNIDSIPNEGWIKQLTRVRKANKVEQIFDFVQGYSGMIDLVIREMESRLPEQRVGSLPDINEQEFLLNPTIITQVHSLCVSENLFLQSFKINDFMNCFDLNFKTPLFPQFKSQIRFAYILTQIDGINAKLAKERFGISSYDTIKGRVRGQNTPEPVFISKVKRALQLHNVKFS